MPIGCVTVCHPESKVEFTAFLPCSASPASEAVPESNKELFEELFHDVVQCERSRDKNGNNVPGVVTQGYEEHGGAGLLSRKAMTRMIYGVKLVMNTSPYLRPDFFWAV